MGLLGKITTLHVHNAFLYFSLPSPHDYDAKIPDFTLLYGGHKQATTNFFFFLSKLECGSQEINSRKIRLHLINVFSENQMD